MGTFILNIFSLPPDSPSGGDVSICLHYKEKSLRGRLLVQEARAITPLRAPRSDAQIFRLSSDIWIRSNASQTLSKSNVLQAIPL
ncbi:jg6967 [Pararge aegeria aegeria]|uniref:Jg6967 protein n=1 Tax=Pararge aegeria aegeria TaxID=348720 RepID=A0A8S4SIQ4_9NEOP|nr:jg6967 [Pararge aegeria aegeria]